MSRWRIKLVFLLIVYFTGFATAIYTLAPVASENRAEMADEDSFLYSAFKSDEFAKSFNSGMHKYVNFGRQAALRMSGYLRDKLYNRNDDG